MKREIARFGVVLLGIFFLYSLLILRLFHWQIIEAENLSRQGKEQSFETLPIAATRGEIQSSDGFPLATNTISYLAYANPKQISDKQIAAEKLSSILSKDTASISAALNRDLFWVRLAENIDSEKKKKIEKLKIPGVGFEQQFSRFYPEASMAAHLIGFLGRDRDGHDHGYFGIEGGYNSQLAGRDGAKYGARDALGNEILNDIRQDPEIDGRSLKLTIDRTIQYNVDKKLSDGIKKYDADGGSIIVMETATGKILGMASRPSFDPKKYYEYEGSSYKNPTLSSLYEPGSTFKVLVMAAALDMGLVKPDTKCNICAGPVHVGEYSIKTWNGEYRPGITMNETIIHSDNTGMVFVGRKIGLDKMISYFKKYGLGEPTGIDLQGETTGVVKDRDDWYTIDLATASFGQGISLTPIQLITAVNSIANGGIKMKPYVVDEILTPDGKTIQLKPTNEGRTVSNVAAKTITNMMINAVEQGEANYAKVKGYKIAGKTGTAQIPIAGHYDPNQTVASFVGFFPPSKPKITMLVIFNRPKSSIYGAETAAPVFFSLARDMIKYYNLPPE